ncbi:MAG: Hpt domain-containing protein [Desulfobacterales bacterium]|nr:Hpt domain-containing protein [Desulfobacterales bacterium]
MNQGNNLLAINIDGLLNRLNKNEQLMIKLLLEFVRDYADAYERIQSALQTDHVPLALKLIHTIKGLAGNLCALQLFENSKTLETAIKHNTGDYQNLMHSFYSSLTEAIHTAQHIIDQNTKHQNTIKTDSLSDNLHTEIHPDVPDMLNTLSVLLQEHNIESGDCLTSIRSMLRHPECQAKLNTLEQSIDKFDFASARHTLNELIKEVNTHMHQAKKVT